MVHHRSEELGPVAVGAPAVVERLHGLHGHVRAAPALVEEHHQVPDRHVHLGVKEHAVRFDQEGDDLIVKGLGELDDQGRRRPHRRRGGGCAEWGQG